MRRKNYISNKHLLYIISIIISFHSQISKAENVRNKEIKIDKFYGVPDESNNSF